MNRKFKKIYTYVALTLLGVGEATLQAQNYGALQYMLQKRPASEKFESNKSNEHLFFTAGIGVQSLLTQKESQDALWACSLICLWVNGSHRFMHCVPVWVWVICLLRITEVR